MGKELQYLLYRTPQEDASIDVVVKDETLWATQKAMAALFDVQVPAISKHLKNIFAEGELDENVVISNLETTTEHGAIAGKTQKNMTRFYNLDAIISVGYRVNSAKATQFRIWATQVLKEFIKKGFVMDDERLKQGKEQISKNLADQKAAAEYDIFNKTQKIESDDSSAAIGNWVCNRNTIEFLGIWEALYNPSFKPLEFEEFKKTSRRS